MSFTLLPAIDVAEGRLAVYTPEGPTPIAAFGGDPLAAAEAVVAAGARWLHVVDLDRAFRGEAGSLGLLGQLKAAYPSVRLQASGGIADATTARETLAAGADRVVLGSGLLADASTTLALLTDLGSRAVVGIEVAQGRIRDRGIGRVDLDLMATIGWLHAGGATAFLVTAVSRVAALAGPDVDLVARVAQAGTPTFAAGGIARLDDLRALRGAGAAGAVVGKAALEGALDLARALDWAAD